MLALGLAGPARADHAEGPLPADASLEAFRLDLTEGLLALPQPGHGAMQPLAAVVVVQDSLGPDLRAQPYVEQLLGSGVAVLEMLSYPLEGAALAVAVARLAEDRRIDPARIGVLAFGSGAGQAAMLPEAFAAAALLYPGCAGLLGLPPDGAAPPPSPAPAQAQASHAGVAPAWLRGWAGRPVLLLHGEADPANPPADCLALGQHLGRLGASVRRVEYRLAGYAWDRPAFRGEGRSLLPAPGLPGRVAAEPWPALAAVSASQVAGFFATAMPATGR